MKNKRWTKAPERGCKNPMADLFRYTVVRLSDRAELFTDRKPCEKTLSHPDRMTWDNEKGREVLPAFPDSRFTVAKEFVGMATRQWVARFCGDWLGHRESREEAEALCRAWNRKRISQL